MLIYYIVEQNRLITQKSQKLARPCWQPEKQVENKTSSPVETPQIICWKLELVGAFGYHGDKGCVVIHPHVRNGYAVEPRGKRVIKSLIIGCGAMKRIRCLRRKQSQPTSPSLAPNP